jgi:hypothetical protein
MDGCGKDSAMSGAEYAAKKGGDGLEHERRTESGIGKLLAAGNVRVTAQAFAKMNAYARIVSKLIGQPSECMGYLIGKRGDLSCTALDAYLLEGQDVYSGKVRPGGDARSDLYNWAEGRGLCIVGMWHSHGSFGLFHSDDDDSALTDLLIDNTYDLPVRTMLGDYEAAYAASIVINQDCYLQEETPSQPVAGREYYCCAASWDRADPDQDIPTYRGVPVIVQAGLEIIPARNIKPLPMYRLAVQVCRRIKKSGSYLCDTDALSAAEQFNDSGRGIIGWIRDRVRGSGQK